MERSSALTTRYFSPLMVGEVVLMMFASAKPLVMCAASPSVIAYVKLDIKKIWHCGNEAVVSKWLCRHSSQSGSGSNKKKKPFALKW